MAKLTLQQKFALALQNRGYIVTTKMNGNGNRFETMEMGPDCTNPVLAASVGNIVKSHRVLLGSGGSLRWTTTTIANSKSFSDKTRARLLSEVEG